MFKSMVIKGQKRKRLIREMAKEGWNLFSINAWEWSRNTFLVTFAKNV